MTVFDRFIIKRMAFYTVFILALLISLFVLIDFSENSDDFTDRGALMKDILNYYRDYIPEMMRLVLPVAVFVSCLILTGQLADRLEIIALKSSGISLPRILLPYLIFGVFSVSFYWYLDGYLIPPANQSRHEFEQKYLNKRFESTPSRNIYRQENQESVAKIGFIDKGANRIYNVDFFDFNGTQLSKNTKVTRMDWNDSTMGWSLNRSEILQFDSSGYQTISEFNVDTTLNLQPRDLQRNSAEVYQLTYPEIIDFLASLERTGLKGFARPYVQFYSKITYPFSILISLLIGVAIASVKIRGGRGVHLAFGLGLSFLYLAALKISEPFGISGLLSPLVAALLPHVVFLIIGLILFHIYRQ